MRACGLLSGFPFQPRTDHAILVQNPGVSSEDEVQILLSVAGPPSADFALDLLLYVPYAPFLFSGQRSVMEWGRLTWQGEGNLGLAPAPSLTNPFSLSLTLSVVIESDEFPE